MQTMAHSPNSRRHATPDGLLSDSTIAGRKILCCCGKQHETDTQRRRRARVALRPLSHTSMLVVFFQDGRSIRFIIALICFIGPTS